MIKSVTLILVSRHRGRWRRRHTRSVHTVEREPCNDVISCALAPPSSQRPCRPGRSAAEPAATTLSPLGKPQAFDYWLKGQAGRSPTSLPAAGEPYPRLGEGPRLGSVPGHTLPRRPRALGQGPPALPGEVLSSGPVLQEPSTDVRGGGWSGARAAYDAAMFDYGQSGLEGSRLPKDLGFAGFRVHFRPTWSATSWPSSARATFVR